MHVPLELSGMQHRGRLVLHEQRLHELHHFGEQLWSMSLLMQLVHGILRLSAALAASTARTAARAAMACHDVLRGYLRAVRNFCQRWRV